MCSIAFSSCSSISSTRLTRSVRTGSFSSTFMAILLEGLQGVVHDSLGLAHNGIQVGLVLEALRVDLVDVFRAGGPGREPAAGGHHLQAADRGVVARGAGQL